MPKKKPVAYCSLTPQYPDSAFILFLFVLHQDDVVGIVPLDAIYETTDQAAEAAKQVFGQLHGTDQIIIPEECLIVPISRQSLYALREDFWQKPTISYTQEMRVHAFEPVAALPEMYALLVTPYTYDDAQKTWYLNAALPFLPTHEKQTIETFMNTSDQVVEPRATHAAIYTIEKKMRFNWKTKEIKKIETVLEEPLHSRD